MHELICSRVLPSDLSNLEGQRQRVLVPPGRSPQVATARLVNMSLELPVIQLVLVAQALVLEHGDSGTRMKTQRLCRRQYQMTLERVLVLLC